MLKFKNIVAEVKKGCIFVSNKTTKYKYYENYSNTKNSRMEKPRNE